jgi:hypothetical protein
MLVDRDGCLCRDLSKGAMSIFTASNKVHLKIITESSLFSCLKPLSKSCKMYYLVTYFPLRLDDVV